jgi:uncharacterized protein (TIGR02611 family)
MEEKGSEIKTPKMVEKLRARKEVHKEMHWLPRILVASLGFFVLLAGIIMLVFPGPAIVVIPIGLAILSLEFVWAERFLEKVLVSGITVGDRFKKLVVHNNWFLAAAIVFALLAVGSAIYIYLNFFN